MAKAKTAPAGAAVVVLTVYHALALLADAETVAENWRRYQRTGSGADFLRLLLAEGVFIKDLGLGA